MCFRMPYQFADPLTNNSKTVDVIILSFGQNCSAVFIETFNGCSNTGQNIHITYGMLTRTPLVYIYRYYIIKFMSLFICNNQRQQNNERVLDMLDQIIDNNPAMTHRKRT